jgi:hypothetical protein
MKGTMKIRDRIKEFKRIDPALIRPNPKNFRTHPKFQRDVLQGVLDDVGIVDAVLVRELDDGTYMLIDGHLRVETITGQDVPALVLDIDPREADEVLAVFDPIGELAGLDKVKFVALLDDFSSTDASVQALCASLAEVETKMREEADATSDGDMKDDGQSGMTCPECGQPVR